MSDDLAPKRSGLDAGVVRRLVIYLAGVAIGFGLLGYFQARSAREAAQRQAEAAAAEGAREQAVAPAERGPGEAGTAAPSNP